MVKGKGQVLNKLLLIPTSDTVIKQYTEMKLIFLFLPQGCNPELLQRGCRSINGL